MKRHIVLIALPFSSDEYVPTPLGHASLLAALQCGHEVEIHQIVCAVCEGMPFPREKIVHQIIELAAQLSFEQIDVAIGAFVWNDEQTKVLLTALRGAGFNGRIILGGPQISYAGEGLEAIYPEADVFIRGQAESALCDLARQAGSPEIHGVHYAGTDDRCEQAECNSHSLPSPWLNGLIPFGTQSSIRWETQRGCRFHCSFCQHKQPDFRMPIAALAESRIDQEIALFCSKGVKRISVLDPIFNGNLVHAKRVLELLIRHGYKGELSLQCRAEMVDDEFLQMAEELEACLEFGLQSIHKREYMAIGRPNNMQKVESVLRNVQVRGIKHEVSLIYGLPEQTLESFKQSVDWCLGIGVPVIKAFPLLLLRGTELDRTRANWLLSVRDGLLPVVNSSSSFSIQEWEKMDRIANALSDSERVLSKKSNDLDFFMSNQLTNDSLSMFRALGRV
ncbi:hypothetical protein GCM10027046_00080 [Uliginosibacterium flavum]|uniref:Radical SAM protein n=1 Tax=Uliginosibacterium flavum TaxID=1396831 RepID=A0ABV2TH34_9RHOO